jgi:hypothetical protein
MFNYQNLLQLSSGGQTITLYEITKLAKIEFYYYDFIFNEPLHLPARGSNIN